MKGFILVLILFSLIFFECKTVDDKALIGSWEIIEFRMIGQVQDPGRNEEFLRKEGAVWDMEFSRNGKFKQSFNMRNPDKRMEIEKGTWRIAGDTLKIEIQTDATKSNWDYTYELIDSTLTFTLAGEKTGSNLVIKFREK